MGQISQKVLKATIWIQRLSAGEAANQILPRSLPNDAIGAQTNI